VGASPATSQRPTFPVVAAGPFDASMVEGLETEADVPFTEIVDCGGRDCTVPLDVLAPADGQALPVYVLVPGGLVEFQWRRYLDLLAAEIARGGAVVVLMTYRSEATGNGTTEGLEDIRCSVRYARSIAGRHGGDPTRVVLVGHSVGSLLVLQLALARESATPHCLAEGDGVPEAVVGLGEFDPAVVGDAEWAPPMLLAGGEDDPLSEHGAETAEQLRSAGFAAEYREFADTGHEELVDPSVTPGIVDLLLEAADRASSPPN